MRHQTFEDRYVLEHRRGEDDQVGARNDLKIVAARIGGARSNRRVDDVGSVDGGDDAGRPAASSRERNRSADQSEPDDGDPGKRTISGSWVRPIIHPWTPQPRRATGSRQMLRPIAGAMIRSSAMRRSNCAGNSDWAPSLSA